MQPAPTTRTWTRYVAIGDSLTEGMADPDPGMPGAYVGWADRLAVELAARADAKDREFGYANLAVRGRLLADVVGPQLDAALALEPDLVSIIGGANDILRPKADVDALAADLEAAVARVRATGADVLMATPADPYKAPLLRAFRGRCALYVACIWGIAQRQGAFVLDQWGQPFLRDWSMWADDRLHMNSEGHQRISLAALSSLGIETNEQEWRTPPPPAQAVPRREAAVANARWAKDHVGPWVQRRLRHESSGDHVTAKRPLVTPLHTPLHGGRADRTID